VSSYVTASPVPLFDRLCGAAPESVDGRLLQAGGLETSLRRDLSRLFNVRNSLTIEQFLACEGTVLHYGLPDLLTLSAESDANLDRLAAVVAHAIALFEPRLSHVQVRALPDPSKRVGARVAISAAVKVGPQLFRVDFDLAANGQTPLAMQPA
jgi:type VI secretion system protein ImpF